MKKKFAAALLAALLLLSACAPAAPAEDGKLHVVATTYPVYLFTTALTEGAEDVEVTLMLREPTSCLHDYTLTVADMKTISAADVIVMNGAGLEDFMSGALARTKAEIIDCSTGIDLLLTEEHEEHEGHDHDEEYDPHYWLHPVNAAVMVENVRDGLVALDPGNAHEYNRNSALTTNLLKGWIASTHERVSLAHTDLITFHDGFRYFADFLGLDILKAIEEEAGSEASAKEIVEIAELVREHSLLAIFTEVNGSEATAKAVARETAVDIYRLDMVMSGDGTGIWPYVVAMDANIDVILEALG